MLKGYISNLKAEKKQIHLEHKAFLTMPAVLVLKLN